jgi:hypothetical protein
MSQNTDLNFVEELSLATHTLPNGNESILELIDLEVRLVKVKPKLQKNLTAKIEGIMRMPDFLVKLRIDTLRPYVEFLEKNKKE